MTHSPETLSQWKDKVSTHFPHLSKPMWTVLALYSYGMILAGTCGRSSVAFALAKLLGQSKDALEQRLREWYVDAADKTGTQRQELDVHTCFTPLLQWVLQWWEKGEHRLAVALDATTLGQRFTVLAISVVCAGCAIPVAWAVVPATEPGAWRPHWLQLLNELKPRLPKGWLVIVLTDRGLWAPWLYKAIVARKWHPFMRINTQGKFLPAGAGHWRPLARVVPAVGRHWRGRVTCFAASASRLVCTLLACWEPEHTGPWLVLTDLSPANADVVWYGLRCHIECLFKDTKRGGLHWEQTKMTDPARAARLWLAMALAILWCVAVGSADEAQQPASGFDALPETHIARRNAAQAAQRRAQPGRDGAPPAGPAPAEREAREERELSLFRRGLLTLLVAFIRGGPLPRARLYAFPWSRNE